MSDDEAQQSKAVAIIERAKEMAECYHVVKVQRTADEGTEIWHYGDLRLRDGPISRKGSGSWEHALAQRIREYHRLDERESSQVRSEGYRHAT